MHAITNREMVIQFCQGCHSVFPIGRPINSYEKHEVGLKFTFHMKISENNGQNMNWLKVGDISLHFDNFTFPSLHHYTSLNFTTCSEISLWVATLNSVLSMQTRQFISTVAVRSDAVINCSKQISVKLQISRHGDACWLTAQNNTFKTTKDADFGRNNTLIRGDKWRRNRRWLF